MSNFIVSRFTFETEACVAIFNFEKVDHFASYFQWDGHLVCKQNGKRYDFCPLSPFEEEGHTQKKAQISSVKDLYELCKLVKIPAQLRFPSVKELYQKNEVSVTFDLNLHFTGDLTIWCGLTVVPLCATYQPEENTAAAILERKLQYLHQKQEKERNAATKGALSLSIQEDLFLKSRDKEKKKDMELYASNKTGNTICDTCLTQPEEICKTAARTGHLNCLKLARAAYCPWDKSICTLAAEKGHLHLLKWARRNGCPWDETVCIEAVNRGDLKMLIWARKNFCPWSHEVYDAAVIHDHFHIFRWAWDNECKYHCQTFALAVTHGRMDVLEYLSEKQTSVQLPDVLFSNEQLSETQKRNIILFLYEKRKYFWYHFTPLQRQTIENMNLSIPPALLEAWKNENYNYKIAK